MLEETAYLARLRPYVQFPVTPKPAKFLKTVNNVIIRICLEKRIDIKTSTGICVKHQEANKCIKVYRLLCFMKTSL